jgi:nitroreductase
MDTSDRGLLDIERFDREPDRPIFHGLIGAVRADDLRGLETKEKIPFFLAIVDEQRMSTRMAASLPEIKTSISTWPQLASGVALGGAITADAARRILLGEHTESGRYYVDPSTIVAAGQGSLREPVAPQRPIAVSAEAQRPPSLPPEPTQGAPLDATAVRWLVAMGTLAPSAHNAQPWRFQFSGGTLECRHDPARDLPSLDFQAGATWLAFGALCETIEMAARHVGWAATTTAFPSHRDPSLVATMTFAPCAPETAPLFPFIATRVTNRRRGSRAPLAASSSDALDRAASSAGARLQLIHSRAALDEIGALMGACDRICLLNAAIHHDAMHGYRWTPEDVERHRDGLDVATMEMSASDRAGLLLLQQWRVPECLAQIGGGAALDDLAVQTIAGASAVGLLTVPGTGRESYFQAGRAVQRLWLTATAQGIALHPMTGLPYLFSRLERGGGEGLAEHEQRALAELRVRYGRLFETDATAAETFLFRLSIAGPPTARSLRRRLDDILVLA